MRYIDILLEYKTKDGRDITFDIIEDEEGDNNRGWQVDKISAFVDGIFAGYIKIGYIPKERFDRYYPSIFNWMYQINGIAILPYDKKSVYWRTFTSDEKKQILKSFRRYTRYMSQDEELQIDNLSDQEIDQEVANAEKKATKNYGEQFKEFYNRFVDNPMDDFIKVFSIGDSMGNRGTGDESKHTFTRQGIATALYFKAVNYLERKGLKLRLSTLRTSGPAGGETLGNSFKDAGLTKKVGEFDYLEPSLVKAYQRKHGITEELVLANW